jgi:hypothetical protein
MPVFPPQRGHDRDYRQTPEKARIGSIAREADVTVPPQVEAAVDQRPLRPSAFDHQKRLFDQPLSDVEQALEAGT